MAKNNNISDLLKSVANAIRAKKGITDLINPQDFDAEIASIPSGSGMNYYGNTGHVDEAGLRALNWNDRDIELLQQTCWWDEDEDDYWKVSQANIDKGLTMTWSNFKNFASDPDIRFFPKLPSPAISYNYFGICNFLYAIPTDGWIPNGSDYRMIWVSCLRLVSVGELRNFITSSVTRASSMFPEILRTDFIAFDTWDISSITEMNYVTLSNTRKLPDISGWKFGSSVQPIRFLYNIKVCTCLEGLPAIPATVGTNSNTWFDNASHLLTIKKAGKISSGIKFPLSPLTRESCLVLFNALDADNPNTITLSAVAKATLSAEDIAIATNKGWTVA